MLWVPEDDGDAPWIWWDVFNLIYREHVSDVVGSMQTSSRARVIDSKAMRKIRNTELQLVIQNADIGALTGIGVDVAVSGRILAGS